MNNTQVVEIINGLKSRLSEAGTMQVQGSSGHVCENKFVFHPSASEKDIEKFERESGWVLPDSYHEFLILHNGALLFADDYGSSYNLLGTSEIAMNALNVYPARFYPIAVYIDGAYILIDSDAVKNGEQHYLVWFDSGQLYPLALNFEEWLDRLIIAQGYPYWYWNL
ncbi:hypothetical protein PAECIP111893_02000 [Paenibacillus plantiphilus]|uniref:Knr4/Smi1-like domain-containing protein n=1 Tax=Paenibacillus plantiphilus TaxID=2905650 RepID=A0ABM9C5Y2_9BACL|nr:SMI1/KNR4 family protein [Paenibacillus plantiphilus]CAH1203567.1 hypothetical protein PAECIP111893_02000 [Paenibacillus plantiphilus]